MNDSSLKKLACDLSNKIWSAAPWNAKLEHGTSDLLYEALKLVDHQNIESRLKCLEIISTFRTSPSIIPIMSGARLSSHQIVNMLDNMYDLLKINLPDIKKEK